MSVSYSVFEVRVIRFRQILDSRKSVRSIRSLVLCYLLRESGGLILSEKIEIRKIIGIDRGLVAP